MERDKKNRVSMRKQHHLLAQSKADEDDGPELGRQLCSGFAMNAVCSNGINAAKSPSR
jgi:hypothetical protein